MDTSYNLHHQNESITNMTKATEEFIISWLHTERGVITEIEVLFIVSALLYVIQVIFGWWRRCSSNTYLKYSLWLAYVGNNSVILYTLGLVQSSSFRNEWFEAWTLSLLIALGSTNSMTAYSLDDNKQYMRHFIQQSLFSLTFLSTFLNFNNVFKTKAPRIQVVQVVIALILMPFLVSINFGRIYASMTASSFLDIETSDLNDHMKSEHTQSTIYDPKTLEGYDYPVCKRIGSPTLITVSQIWLSDEGILGSSSGKQLKKVCLSFALFQLLRRRFFGIACPESKLPKTRDLVLKGLLPDEEAAYRVIAVELAFAHDHFFTSSASFNTKLCKQIFFLSFGKLTFYVLMLIFSFIPNKHKDTSSSSTRMVPSTLTDRIVSAVIMLVLSAMELLQLYLYLSSDWAKVQIVRLFISGKDIPFTFRIFCNMPQILGYWHNKIGQHSLLKDLHGRSLIADIIGSMSGCFFGEFSEYHSVISRGICRPGVKGASRIPLPGDVKSAVAQALKASNGKLSNGASSLQRNAPQRGLTWACCEQENHTSTMLIWHIATEYCELAQAEGSRSNSNSSSTIASTLAKYCAYLMAYVPELLPDHELDVRKLFDQVRQDALDMLSKERTPKAKYIMMRNFKEQPNDQRIFVKGIRLGKQLMAIRHDERWKILADFWTEMILYTAPSENTKAHMEHLANGGEFLTHLWTLLFHAGIVGREEDGDVPSHDIESPATEHNNKESQDSPFLVSNGDDEIGQSSKHGHGDDPKHMWFLETVDNKRLQSLIADEKGKERSSSADKNVTPISQMDNSPEVFLTDDAIINTQESVGVEIAESGQMNIQGSQEHVDQDSQLGNLGITRQSEPERRSERLKKDTKMTTMEKNQKLAQKRNLEGLFGEADEDVEAEVTMLIEAMLKAEKEAIVAGRCSGR